ncbi:MAG: hypothetical protein GXO60_05145 [Epsilonproteobacteria bacterium]|nr:hypothetical protein [Campylobacterota bacterium]
MIKFIVDAHIPKKLSLYKLIYISTGNITNKQLLKIFSHNIDKIVEFISENRLIEITQESIVVKG